jgi:hypothetical protein
MRDTGRRIDYRIIASDALDLQKFTQEVGPDYEGRRQVTTD